MRGEAPLNIIADLLPLVRFKHFTPREFESALEKFSDPALVELMHMLRNDPSDQRRDRSWTQKIYEELTIEIKNRPFQDVRFRLSFREITKTYTIEMISLIRGAGYISLGNHSLKSYNIKYNGKLYYFKAHSHIQIELTGDHHTLEFEFVKL